MATALTSSDLIYNLPPPGSVSFLPSLLAHICAVTPGLPLEPIIVQVLLLCIVSGDRNLILRTREEDIGLVSRLATIALTSVFGYTTHKLRCHIDAKSQSSTEFLRSLFLPPATTAADGFLLPHYRHHRSSTTLHSRKPSFPRTTSFPSDAPSIQRDLQPAAPDHLTSSADVPLTETPDPAFHTVGVHSESSLSNFTSGGNIIHQRRTPHVKIPSAIVVSGLEYASLSAQRAVLRTLAENKFVLHGNPPDVEPGLSLVLPVGFIMIYVCRLDSRERPPIYNSLLDRFAMSTPINIQSATRTAMHHYQHHRTPSASTGLPSPSTPGHSHSNFLTLSPSTPPPPPPNNTTPIISAMFLAKLKHLCANQVRMRPPLNIYLADLFTATRHFGALDAMMLTARARQDAEALVRAARVLGVDQTGAELIKEVATDTADRDSITEGVYTSSSVSVQSFEALIDGSALPFQSPDVASLHTHCSMRSLITEGAEPLELDVSEADVARIFPRVVSHRVRVRDSPVDEILSSAICGAVSWPRFTPKEVVDIHDPNIVWERETVKDILVHVLATV